EAPLDAEGIVEDLHGGRQTIRRARSVGDDPMLLAVIGRLVDAEHDGDVGILGRRGDDDLLRSRLQMLRGGGGVAEDAGRLDDHLDAELLPGQAGRILQRRHPHLSSVDEDGSVLRVHFGRKVAVNGVVLEQVGERLGVGQIIDTDDLDVAIVEGRPEEDATDAAEAVHADPSTHGELLVDTAGVTRSDYIPRATVSTPTARAPATRSARQHSATVAPVVRTSSTTTT